MFGLPCLFDHNFPLNLNKRCILIVKFVHTGRMFILRASKLCAVKCQGLVTFFVYLLVRDRTRRWSMLVGLRGLEFEL